VANERTYPCLPCRDIDERADLSDDVAHATELLEDAE
jgi:hypothetical protein